MPSTHLALCSTAESGSSNGTSGWDAVAIEGVATVIERAARKTAMKFGVEFEDLLQDARVRVATRPDLFSCTTPDLYGLLYFRLERDLTDIARSILTERSRRTSYEQRYDERSPITGSTPTRATTDTRSDASEYDTELVKLLLPALWDDFYCYGVRVENAPDADMPRGSTDKSTGNTLAAHIADIKTGWAQAPLSLNERRALLLGYGLGWTQAMAADVMGVTSQGVGKMQGRGVSKIVARLNGTTVFDTLEMAVSLRPVRSDSYEDEVRAA